MPPSRSRIIRMLEQQDREFQRLTDEQTRAFLKVFEHARRELLEELELLEDSGGDLAMPFTAQRMRVMLAQVEQGVERMQDRLGVVLTQAERQQQKLALAHLIQTIEAHEGSLLEAGPRINLEALRQLESRKSLQLWKHSLRRYGADVITDIHRELAVAVVRGQTYREMTRRVAGKSSLIASKKGRAQLIVRMETSRFYNDAHLQGIETANDELDPEGLDPVLKKADEFTDKRNHPFSRVLGGQAVAANAPFRVSIAKVKIEAEAMGRSASGVVWTTSGGDYIGHNLPAHYNDRGRIIPWRESWASTTAVHAAGTGGGGTGASPPQPAPAPKKLVDPQYPQGSEEFAKARQDLQAHEAAMVADGLKPGQVAVSPRTAALHQLVLGGPPPALSWELEQTRTLVGFGSGADAQELTRRLRTELTRIGQHQALFKRVSDHAPKAWADAERSRLVDEMVPRRVRHRAAVKAMFERGLQGLAPDRLQLLRAEGVVLRRGGLGGRAMGEFRNGPGLQEITVDEALCQAVAQHRGVAPGSVVDSTVLHEATHAVDWALGRGRVGVGWKPRPGYSGVDTAWVSGIKGPFDKTKGVVGPVFEWDPVRLRRVRVGTRWSGAWVEAYEGTVYSFPGGDGPVEFPTRAAQYLLDGRLSVLGRLARGDRPLDALASALKTRQGLALTRYGTSYAAAMNAGIGLGDQLLADAMDAGLTFKNDDEVILFGMGLEGLFGVPMSGSLGPGGRLAALLQSPWNGTTPVKKVGDAHVLMRRLLQAAP